MNIEHNEIPLEVRWYAVGQDAIGIKQVDIVDLVRQKFGLYVTQGAISKIFSKYKANGTVMDLPRDGRPKKLTIENEGKIVKAVKEDRTLNATKVARDEKLNPLGDFHVSARTISRSLNSHGLKDSTDIIEQIPSEAEIQRFNFAVQCQQENIDWKSVIFTDESDLFPDKQGKLHYRRYKGEKVDLDVGIGTRWDARKVKVWGSVSNSGVGTIVRFHDTVNSDKYIKILDEVLLKDFPLLKGTKTRRGKFLLQQDNARPHVSSKTLQYLNYQNIHYLKWPSYSPDLSPIENVWGFIKEELYKKNDVLVTADETWEEIKRIWYFKVNLILEKLYKDIPIRIQKVIDRQGKRIN